MTKPTRPPVETPGDGFVVDTSRPDDPRIQLSVSKDGGATWLAQAMKPLGALGEYAQRVRWHRCGSGFGLVLRFTVSDPVPLAALDLQLEVE